MPTMLDLTHRVTALEAAAVRRAGHGSDRAVWEMSPEQFRDVVKMLIESGAFLPSMVASISGSPDYPTWRGLGTAIFGPEWTAALDADLERRASEAADREEARTGTDN